MPPRWRLSDRRKPRVVVASSLTDVAKLVGAVAWPLVAAVAVLWLRSPVAELVQDIRPRLKKLSLGSFSLELAEIDQASAPGLAALIEPLSSGAAASPRNSKE